MHRVGHHGLTLDHPNRVVFRMRLDGGRWSLMPSTRLSLRPARQLSSTTAEVHVRRVVLLAAQLPSTSRRRHRSAMAQTGGGRCRLKNRAVPGEPMQRCDGVEWPIASCSCRVASVLCPEGSTRCHEVFWRGVLDACHGVHHFVRKGTDGWVSSGGFGRSTRRGTEKRAIGGGLGEPWLRVG